MLERDLMFFLYWSLPCPYLSTVLVGVSRENRLATNIGYACNAWQIRVRLGKVYNISFCTQSRALRLNSHLPTRASRTSQCSRPKRSKVKGYRLPQTNKCFIKSPYRVQVDVPSFVWVAYCHQNFSNPTHRVYVGSAANV